MGRTEAEELTRRGLFVTAGAVSLGAGGIVASAVQEARRPHIERPSPETPITAEHLQDLIMTMQQALNPGLQGKLQGAITADTAGYLREQGELLAGDPTVAYAVTWPELAPLLTAVNHTRAYMSYLPNNCVQTRMAEGTIAIDRISELQPMLESIGQTKQIAQAYVEPATRLLFAVPESAAFVPFESKQTLAFRAELPDGGVQGMYLEPNGKFFLYYQDPFCAPPGLDERQVGTLSDQFGRA